MPPKAKARSQEQARPSERCDICAHRRVACDRLKPSCGSCLKSSRFCEYSSSPIIKNQAQLRVALYRPKKVALLIDPGVKGEDQVLAYYCNHIAGGLGGLFESKFWTRHVPKLARTTPSVHDVVVSLVQAAEAMSQDYVEARQHEIGLPKQNLNKADTPSIEVILVTHALFVATKMFQGHHEQALRIMSEGLYIYFDWKSKVGISAVQARDLSTEVDRVWGRFFLQMVLFVDTKPAEWQFLVPAFTPVAPAIPTEFETIDEARNVLNGCMCSIYHAVLTSVCTGGGEELSPDTVFRIKKIFQQWHTGFRAFVVAHRPMMSAEQKCAALVLEVQGLAAIVVAGAGAFAQEMIFDDFEQEFLSINSLATQVILSLEEQRDNDNKRMPAIDMGILPSLYYVASRCRHPSIRREALDLLRRGPEQEGIWYSRMLFNVAKRIMILEEATCLKAVHSSSDVSASARLSTLNATVDLQQRVIVLHCVRQQDLEKGAETLVIHEIVPY